MTSHQVSFLSLLHCLIRYPITLREIFSLLPLSQMHSLPPRPLHKSATLVFPDHSYCIILISSFYYFRVGVVDHCGLPSVTPPPKPRRFSSLYPPSLLISLSRCIARLTSSRPLHSSQISSPSHHQSSTNLTQSSKFFPILTTFPIPS